MSHEHALEGKFLAGLGAIDAERARRVQAERCRHCGGPLDRADYPRKPRGELGEAGEAYTRRLSLCCRVDGCRRRATPPSLRFFGRKVYFAALVVIASAMGQGRQLIGRGRVTEVRGVPVRTVRRWLGWWQAVFALSAFWAEGKALFAAPIAVEALPTSLLGGIGGEYPLKRTLAFLAPITTTSVRTRIEMAV